MKKIKVFIVLVIIAILQLFNGCLSAKTPEESKEVTPGGKLPQILSPEDTLKTYLNAFVSRDIETVMAYLPNGTSKNIIEYRERSKVVLKMMMSEEKHIKAVESVKLVKIEERKNGKFATIEATIVTTPNFSALVNCDEKGKCTATFQWLFRQSKENGPWIFDGGGF